jgi:hypothetical protein
MLEHLKSAKTRSALAEETRKEMHSLAEKHSKTGVTVPVSKFVIEMANSCQTVVSSVEGTAAEKIAQVQYLAWAAASIALSLLDRVDKMAVEDVKKAADFAMKYGKKPVVQETTFVAWKVVTYDDFSERTHQHYHWVPEGKTPVISHTVLQLCRTDYTAVRPADWNPGPQKTANPPEYTGPAEVPGKTPCSGSACFRKTGKSNLRGSMEQAYAEKISPSTDYGPYEAPAEKKPAIEPSPEVVNEFTRHLMAADKEFCQRLGQHQVQVLSRSFLRENPDLSVAIQKAVDNPDSAVLEILSVKL